MLPSLFIPWELKEATKQTRQYNITITSIKMIKTNCGSSGDGEPRQRVGRMSVYKTLLFSAVSPAFIGPAPLLNIEA